MNKRKIYNRIVFVGLVIITSVGTFISGCSKSPLGCFTSTGNIENTERQLPYFHSIQLNNNINVQLIPSTQNKLTLEAGANLKPKIITEVNGDSTLIIQNNNSCNWVRSYDKPINVYLEFTALKNIEYRSIGDLTNIDTLRMDSLQINVYEGAGKIHLAVRTHQCEANLHYGTTDILLSGETDLAFFYQLGAGKIDAQNLESAYVYLRNWSSNNMFVWSYTQMSAEIKGLGNVYYKGKPVIESSILGEGLLIPLE